ncbi:MAG TPA: hypothetical protein VIS71_05945, partial [Terrimicrobium sp.]
ELMSNAIRWEPDRLIRETTAHRQQLGLVPARALGIRDFNLATGELQPFRASRRNEGGTRKILRRFAAKTPRGS